MHSPPKVLWTLVCPAEGGKGGGRPPTARARTADRPGFRLLLGRGKWAPYLGLLGAWASPRYREMQHRGGDIGDHETWGSERYFSALNDPPSSPTTLRVPVTSRRPVSLAFSRAVGDHAVALGVLPTGPRMLREAGSMYYA